MKASQQQQQTLLDLGQIDLQMRRARIALGALDQSSELEEVRVELMKLSENLRTQRNALDALEIELSRAAQDLNLVEDRIARDKQRLESSSNPKDVQGIQHELLSLAKRKDTLEEAEIVLLEKVEMATAEVVQTAKEREACQQKLQQLENSRDAEIAKLKSGLVLLTEDRNRAKANLSTELADHYEKLKDRGAGVGRLNGISCGVCGMTMSGSGLDEVRATPMDELAHCSECNGILVR